MGEKVGEKRGRWSQSAGECAEFGYKMGQKFVGERCRVNANDSD